MRRELDDLKSFLRESGAAFVEEQVQYGTQLICRGGEKITHYTNSGKVVARGAQTELGRRVEAWAKGFDPEDHNGATGSPVVRPSKQVFVVYGHDTDARNAIEVLLRRMNLEPIILENLPPDGDTIIEKLEEYLGENGSARFACVLLTPDDEGYPKDKVGEKRYRARQNVILELGMVLGRLGRKRVAILCNDTVEQPSDIAGLIYIPFRDRVEEVNDKLRAALEHAGFAPENP